MYSASHKAAENPSWLREWRQQILDLDRQGFDVGISVLLFGQPGIDMGVDLAIQNLLQPSQNGR